MPIVVSPPSIPGGTAVPTNGAFVNGNWVEVFDTHHDFTGRTIITNGLQLLDIQTGQQQLANCYLWNTALSTPAWQQWCQLANFDNAGNQATLRQISLIRTGPEESAVSLITSTSGNQVARYVIRLQRGRYEGRVDFSPLTQASTTDYSLAIFPSAANGVIYTDGGVKDSRIAAENGATGGAITTYGYNAEFVPSTSWPLIWGFLYQNQTVDQTLSGTFSKLALGDTASLAINAQRSYGFYAIPYGVFGTYSTANLIANANTGTLGTGWSSVADALAENGNAAKAASGTLAGNDDKFGTAWSPAAGLYDVWFRIRVTTNVGSNAEMTLQVWDPTAGSAVVSTTFNRTSMFTTYTWIRVFQGVTLPAAHATQFRAVTALTLGTDWFIDEGVLVPRQLTTDNRGPQDIFQQFLFDRSTRLVRT